MRGLQTWSDAALSRRAKRVFRALGTLAWRRLLVVVLISAALVAHGCSEGTSAAPPGRCPEPDLGAPPPDPRAGQGLWLVEIGRAAQSRSVVELLDHPLPKVRARAALAAGRLGTEALGRAVTLRLGDEAPEVRQAACEAIALADHRAAEEALLVRLATDPDPGVQRAALRALGLVGGTPAVKALVTLVKEPASPDALRREALLALALLARRGASQVRPAVAVALEILGRGQPPPQRSEVGMGAGQEASEEAASMAGTASHEDAAVSTAVDPAPEEDRRAAAYLLATLVDRFAWAGKRITASQKRALAREALVTRDPELLDALGRATVKLGLHGLASLAALVRRAGQAGRAAAEALVTTDAPRGSIVQSLVESLIKELPKTACQTASPVMLWELLGQLAQRAEAPWLAPASESWVGGLRELQKKAETGSCAALQMARLTCRAAVVADRAARRLKHSLDCGAGLLGEDEVAAFGVESLGSPRFGRRVMSDVVRRYDTGGPRTRVAALEVAGRLGGPVAERLIQRGLEAKEGYLVAAAAEACGVLRGARPLDPVGQGAFSEEHPCAATCRGRLLSEPSPPGVGEVMRWIELIKHLGGFGDDALVERLKVAARHPHPTLRAHAQSSLGRALGRRPVDVSWDSDPRQPPAEPLHQDVTLLVETSAGRLTLRLRHAWAPLSTAHLLDLAEAGSLTGSVFHRVVPGFVIQGGDPSLTGYGGDTGLLLSEWSDVRFRRGVVGLAHAGKDTEGSQLFIVLGSAPHLDFRYTAVGEITQGLELADALLPGEPLSLRVIGAVPRTGGGK